MARKRQIKRYGNTWVIKLSPSDVIDFGLVENDVVDIDDLNLLEEGVKEDGKRS